MNSDLKDEPASLGDALPAEIARVQAKHSRWIGYARQAGPQVARGMEITMQFMQIEINEAVKALASGDVVRMIRAHEALKGYSDDD
jgi:hypothetical protein